MKIELRADGAHISGYVNATEKKSRPVITPRGKVIEVIEPRAFEKAIERAGNVTVLLDHEYTHIYAETREGSCTLYEDAIGLHADVLVTDPNVIELAKKGKLRGWSFGMTNVVDEMEARAEGELPIRHVKELDLDHISLVARKNPAYSATSVELRAEEEVDVEIRSSDETVQITEIEPKKPETSFFDTRVYRQRADALKKS